MTDKRRSELEQELTRYAKIIGEIDVDRLTVRDLPRINRLLLCAEATARTAIREAEKVLAPPPIDERYFRSL